MKIILIALILIALLLCYMCMLFLSFLITIKPKQEILKTASEEIHEEISQSQLDEEFEKSSMKEFNRALTNLNAILTDQEEVLENEQTK